jgi:antitoxin component of MazEF toxin-antitoxin module
LTFKRFYAIIFIWINNILKEAVMNVKTMRVNRWGNSLGVRFPNEFASFIGLSEKSIVEIRANKKQQLIITKLEEKPEKPQAIKSANPTIKELFELYPEDFIQEEEIDWGEAVGEEVW